MSSHQEELWKGQGEACCFGVPTTEPHNCSDGGSHVEPHWKVRPLGRSFKGFKLESGDVTSAFLQRVDSLEDEELFVWTPAELAALFGAEAGEETILKLTKAFYGLVHAPKKWHESVAQALLRSAGQTLWFPTGVVTGKTSVRLSGQMRLRTTDPRSLALLGTLPGMPRLRF